jgi:hypothetical protein
MSPEPNLFCFLLARIESASAAFAIDDKEFAKARQARVRTARAMRMGFVLLEP